MASQLATITENIGHVDLSARFRQTTTIATSPAAGTETIIATLTLTSALQQATGIELRGFAAYTVGTNGISVNLKIRRTDASGQTVVATGATTAVAANLGSQALVGIDTGGAIPGQVYVLTMLVGSGSAVSTVSAVYLAATII